MDLRSKGMGELSSGDLNESIKTFTEAIDISNTSTVLFVKRATSVVLYVKLYNDLKSVSYIYIYYYRKVFERIYIPFAT